MSEKNSLNILKNGIATENPTFVQLLGMCPTLAVTTSLINAIGMGLSATFVLIFSNLVISLLRKFIPSKIRIASYIVVIAAFVSVIEMLLKAYLPAISDARAESFASKNKPIPSVFDGLGMGLGFTLGLSVLGSVREILGAGTLLGISLFGKGFQPALIFILPPGAFLALGVILAVYNMIKDKKGAGVK